MREYISLLTADGSSPYQQSITTAFENRRMKIETTPSTEQWKLNCMLSEEDFYKALQVNEYLSHMVSVQKKTGLALDHIAYVFVMSPTNSPIYHAITDFDVSNVPYPDPIKNIAKQMYGYASGSSFKNQKEMHGQMNMFRMLEDMSGQPPQFKDKADSHYTIENLFKKIN